jgi:hypothetical protein
MKKSYSEFPVAMEKFRIVSVYQIQSSPPLSSEYVFQTTDMTQIDIEHDILLHVLRYIIVLFDRKKNQILCFMEI